MAGHLLHLIVSYLFTLIINRSIATDQRTNRACWLLDACNPLDSSGAWHYNARSSRVFCCSFDASYHLLFLRSRLVAMVNLSANDHSKFQLTTGTGALHQADSSRQPSNTPGIAPYKLSNEDATYATSFSERAAGRMSRDPSSGSGVGQMYNEKTRGPSPRKIQKRPSTARSQGRKSSSKDDEPAIMQNGSHHVSMADSAKLPTPTKRKKSGLGGVIRRIFGRRSVKNRISLPGPVEHRHHVGFARQLLDIELTFKGSAQLHHLALRSQTPPGCIGAIG